MIYKSPRVIEGFFVCLGRDHLRVVRAGLVLGAIGGFDYEGSKGRAYKIIGHCGRGGARPSQLLLPKILASDRRRVVLRRRCVDPCNRQRSFCVAASRRGRERRGT
jgi:hypothetical protein